MTSTGKPTRVHTREVWAHNLEHEFQLISEIAIDYPYLALSTKFSGFVAQRNCVNNTDSNYENMKNTVNLFKLIQVGLTLSDENGNRAGCGTTDDCVWQFNFRFDLEEDCYVAGAIRMLQKAGIDFQVNAEQGIESERFSELLKSSGIVQNKFISWLTFEGGYHFGYLLKLLTGQDLPDSQDEFFHLLQTYFPVIYDIKYMMKCNNLGSGLSGGLEKRAETLGVKRI